MTPLLKKRLFNTILIVLFLQASYGQSKVDTTNVILTTAEQFVYWKGYDDNLNDTTRLIKSLIGKLNQKADSILITMQRAENVVYSQEIIDHYKVNFFALATLAKLADPANTQYEQEVSDAFKVYIGWGNTNSLLQQYSQTSRRSFQFMQQYYEVNKNRNRGAGWNPSRDPSPTEKSLAFIAPAAGKRVKVNCGNGIVYHNGEYGGPGGLTLVLFRGMHTIEIRENNITKCRYDLLVAEGDFAPTVVSCTYPASPCSCNQ